MDTFKYELGDEVRDTITGFIGVIMARTEWFNRCIRYQVQSTKLNKDGQPLASEPFDEPQLVLVKAARKAAPEPVRRTGGPQRDPRPLPAMRR